MDWIHCNKCFGQLAPGIQLNLTNCGHMFCNNCLNHDLKDTVCIVCQAPCSVMKLVPDMKPEVQEYFTEPEEMLKKTCEVLQFQKQHRRRLVLYLIQSAKKFYAGRNELKRLSELCKQQYNEIKEYKKIIKKQEAELANESIKQVSSFDIPISPGSNGLSPNIQCTPTYKRTAKSTPYSLYQSNLVTPSRLTTNKQRSGFVQSQKSNTSNKISSTVFTPPSQESAGRYHSQGSNESGYLTHRLQMSLSPIMNTSQYGRRHN